MKKNILYTLFLSITALFFLNACGTDSKANADSVPTSQIGITHSIACFENTQVKDIYVGHCYVHTVDANSDPINGLTYEVSVVTNVKASSLNNGTILTTNPITFSDDSQTFIKSAVQKTDTVIILPKEDKNDISYLGNWQIVSVNSNNNITLKENAFNLETTEELTYVIGNETRIDLGGSASAHIEYPKATVDTIDNLDKVGGLFYFDIYYDPSLRGETVFIGVHTTSGLRTGTAKGLILELEDANTTA